ncbi:hypothetical protein FB45DRAFT_909940 [Roridomyces roridus]|uniref:RING-type domain-containing protein n=1 Tax=Roridomyces roridus TaxID=1738132 RepID=A0AAD7BZG9_9AGAR|nr:hypothetical protein FB45DRAFT_909940 [Roridomyces roridus]
MSSSSGLPLLSGPPPVFESTAPGCRKCGKEFNFLLTRQRKCNHCGHSYCHSCTDYQGLMPRGGNETGYDVMNVCAFCIEFLTVTASGRGQLKQLPLAKIKKYISAYNIKADRAVEKDDLIDAIIHAKGPNGCLPSANENYYRKYSVPDRYPNQRSRGLFSRNPGVPTETPLPPRPPQPATYEFARPDLQPDDPPQRFAPPPGPPPHTPNATRPSPNATRPSPQNRPHSSPRPSPHPSSQYHSPDYHSQAHYNGHRGHPSPHSPPPAAPRATRPQQQQQPHSGPYQNPRSSRSSHNLNPNADRTPPRPRAASTAPPPTAPPTLEQLLTMSPDSVSTLSVHVLKDILFTNHVNPGQVLEKSDLVKKVRDLIDEERRQRERQRLAEEQEEQERIARQHEMMEDFNRQQREREERARAAAPESVPPAAEGPAEGSNSETAPPPPLPPKAQAMASHLERTGLCVICQDEEANIAIVDCGHLAMCRGCSDLIMNSSRECPLCRTRIVTEARLLRIFKS